MAVTLETSIQRQGWNQADVVKYFENVRDLANELQTDHGTFKTVVDEMKTLVNQLRQMALYQPLGNPTLAINTNFDIKNTEPISYLNAGTLKTLADNTTFDTGTQASIAANKWGAARLGIRASGTTEVTWVTGTAGTGYTTEAQAIAAVAAYNSTVTPIGLVTVRAHASNKFVAGTDALTTGTGGNVAQTTTYYNTNNAGTEMVTSAVSNSAPASLSNSTALTLLRA